MQVGERARLAEAARAALDPAGGETAGPRAAHRHRAGERRCRHAAVRRHRPGAGGHSRVRGWPARSPSPMARCTTSPNAAPGGAPLNVLIPAKGEETDRRLRVIEAPELRHRRQDRHAARGDRGSRRRRTRAASANLTIRRDGEPPRVRERADRRGAADRAADHPRRPHRGGTVGDTARRRGLHDQQPRGGRDQRRARPAARAADLRRAASRRAHLAAAAEGGPVGRSGALHHPAPAGEGRPDAAERAGADRLPGARAVPRQDQRVRPDHPGPVPEPRPAADALHRQHRRARARPAARCC